MKRTKWWKRCLGIFVFSLLFCLGGRVGHAQEIVHNGWKYNSDTRELKISGVSEITTSLGITDLMKKNIRTITIGNDVKSVGDGALEYFNILECVRFEDKSKSAMTSFGKNAFRECPALKLVQFPNKLSRIGEGCFMYDEHLDYIEIPSTVTSLGRDAFRYSGVKQVVIKNGLKRLPDYAFGDCDQLQKVVLPDSITEIASGCFYKDVALSGFNFPKYLQKIEGYAFSNCKALSFQSLPSTLTELNGRCFEGCKSIKKLVIPKSLRTTIYEPFAESGLQEITYEQGTTNIPSSQFQYCNTLKKVTLPDSVKSISDYAFKDCTNLSEVKLSSNLQSIGYDAFAGCCQLHKITIPATVTSTSTAFAFSGLEEISFGYGMKKIPNFACDRCSYLRNVYIPDTVQTIGYCSFRECASLTYVKIPKSVTTISEKAFMICGRLGQIDMECQYPWLGEDCFDYGKHNVFYGVYGSGVDQYCQSRGLNFVAKYKDLQYVAVYNSNVVENRGYNTMPQVSVWDNGRELRQNVDYTMSVSNNNGLGTATITISGIGNGYYGTVTRTFTIIPARKEVYQIGNLRYQITDASTNGRGTVTVVSMVKRSSKVTIPKTVKIGGYKYRVTAIGKKAFYKQSSLKKIYIQSKEISWIGKKAFFKVNNKAFVQVPKKCYSRYKSMIKGSTIKKTLGIRK